MIDLTNSYISFIEGGANDNSPASKMALYIADFERHCDEREALLEHAIQACEATIRMVDEYAAKLGGLYE